MKTIDYFIICFISIMLLSACGKDPVERYDNPFISITHNGSSSVSVSTEGTFIGIYNIYLSSGMLKEDLTVTYEITIGDGLTEEIDYELLTTGNQLVFPTGVYEMPIYIRWLRHEVDETKDNTIRIRLISNSMDFTIGLPGPSGYQKQLIITKENP